MNPFHGRHFQGEIILWAVRWYCKYGISYRELHEMPVYRLNCVSESFFESMYFIRRLCTNAKKIRVQISIKKVLVF